MVLRLELGREPRLGGGAPGLLVGAAVSSLGKVRDLSYQRKPRVDLGEKGLLAEVQPHPHQEMEERWGEVSHFSRDHVNDDFENAKENVKVFCSMVKNTFVE